MRKWNVVALLLAFGFIASPIVSAQSDDDLRREVDQLKRDLNKVMNQNQRILAENAELRDTVDSVGISALEDQINVLAESIEYAPGTSVNSKANPVTISGEFRIRDGLTFDRNFNDDDDQGTFHDARFRVALTFDFTEDVTTHFEMQANGLYNNNDTPDTPSNLSNIDLYQGWIEFRNVFGRQELSNRSGRQEIVLGNEFIFGDNDFFSGETHDGTHWKWEGESFNLHVIVLKTAIQDNFSTVNHPYAGGNGLNGHDDDEIYSLYFTLKSIENHTLDLFWVYFSGESTGTSAGPIGAIDLPATGNPFPGAPATKANYHTVGLSLRGMFEVAAGLDYAINFAYQFGDIDDNTSSADADIEGLAVEAEVGITFEGESNFRIFVRVLFSEGSDGSDSGFIPLFLERHSNDGYRARYGLMDIIPVTNVLSAQLGVHFDPAADWTIGATVLWATTDEDINVGGQDEDEYGFEIDVWAEYRYSEETTLSAGLGVYFPEEATPTANGGLAGTDDDIAFLLFVQTRVVF